MEVQILSSAGLGECVDYLYTKLLTKDLILSERFVRDVLGARIIRQQDECFECDLFGQLIVFECLSTKDSMTSNVNQKIPIVVSERYQLDLLFERCMSHDVEIIQKPVEMSIDYKPHFYNLIIKDPMGYKIEFKYYTLQVQGVGD